MSEQVLKEMIGEASEFAESLFRKTGQLRGMFRVVTGGGRELFVKKPFPDQKNLSAAVMREFFKVTKTQRFVYMDEAWAVEKKSVSQETLDRMGKYGLEHEPGRIEVLIFQAEDHERHMTAHRDITRDADGKPTLGPLVYDPMPVEAKGRMVGMLQPEGAMQ